MMMSGLIYGTPWVGGICTESMHLVGHDGEWGFNMGEAARGCASD